MMSQEIPLSVRFTMRGDVEVRDMNSGEDLPLDFSSRKRNESAVNLSTKPEWKCEPSPENVQPSCPSFNSISPIMCSSSPKQNEPLLGIGLFNNFLPVAATPSPPPIQSPLLPMSGKGGKTPRPFKAYPKDPLSLPVGLGGLTMGVSAAEALISQASNQAYSDFRRQMLAQVQSAKCRKPRPSRPSSEEPPQQPESSCNDQQESPSKRRNSTGSSSGKSNDNSIKDDAYWERRRKNNEAAKRSRDARRAKEDEIAIRAAFLEQENLKLKYEVAALRNETAKLRCLLYNS